MSLGFRILQEEFEKSEQLELLQKQMENELLEERQKRSDLEELKQNQEKMLREEQQKLEQLELDRKAADEKLEVRRFYCLHLISFKPPLPICPARAITY